MTLDHHASFRLYPSPPFHFDGTFHKPDHFTHERRLEEWRPGKYWQTFRWGRIVLGLRILNRGTIVKPCLQIDIYSARSLKPAVITKLKEEICYRFELTADLREFRARMRSDNRFAPVFKKWLGMRNACPQNLYELLMIAIVLQNATVRRSAQMLDVLLSTYGTRVVFDGHSLHAMWPPERLKRVSERALRRLRLGYRAKFIKHLSRDFIDQWVDEARLRRLEKADLKQELMKLYGIGPETARILLFEAFHYYDTFDHIAPWQQKIYSRLFYDKSLVGVKRIQRDITKRYGPFAMLAVHYIWEDIFWRRKHESIPWLEKEIRR